MSDLQQYSKVTVYYNSNLLVEEVSMGADRESGAQVVKTVSKGFAGTSPGSPMMTIEIVEAVPANGFDISTLGPDMKNQTVREVTLFSAGKSLTTKGFVMKDSLKHGVDKESELSFSMTCEWADWQ